MAETAAAVVVGSNGAGGPEPESDSALFHRRIEFHKARRQFNGFVNDSTSGFKLVTLNPTSGQAVAPGLGKRTEKKPELAEAGLDPELSFEISFRRIGAGLRNLGNTCFLNSVLQCLTYTAPLAAYLQSGKHQNSCRTAGFCALCAIQRHVSRALQSTGRILEPKDLVSNLRCISRSFRNARQEDAHEYMVNLLESMHKCCLPTGVPSESPSAYEKSLVHKIFGGRLRSQVKCMQCSYCSNKFDPFLDLSLEIPKADSLYKALSHFTAKEQLDGGAREYHCEQCRQKVKALKQLTIHKAPEVLAVHLKRFSSLSPGQKIDKRVNFEPTLDLKPFVTGPYDGDLKYTLYGVLVHYGWNTHSGHYYCFVRTSSGMWYSLDDNQVVQVNERKVLEQKAYMLFYVRDRKHVGPKNHVSALQKENMAMNAAYTKLNLELKDKILKGSDERKLNGSCSAALSGKDAPVTPPPKETPSEKMCSKTNGGLAPPPKETPSEKMCSKTNGGLATETNGKCESLLVPATEAPLKEQSSLKINSSVNGSVEVNITCNNTLSGSQDSLHKNEASNSVAMSSGMEKPSESAGKPLSEDKCKVDGAIPEMNAKTSMPMMAIGEPSVAIDNVLPAVSCNGAEETIENGKRVDVESELSDLPATNEPITLGMTKGKRRDLKVKRKLLKYQARSLSSNLLLGVGICIRKKKHKQKRHRSVLKKSPNMKDENDVALAKSATEKSSPQVENSTRPHQEEKAKCLSDHQNQNLSVQNTSGDSRIPGDAIDNEFRERILLNGSAVSSEKQPVVEHSAVQGNEISEESKRELRQIEIMSMLTGGLETPVGRWDDNGVSHSKKSEKRAAGTAQIGYIGDEWDEEYDRGKRKKVRLPVISFDGPNLFQEVATERSKSKKAKLNRSRDGNQPFRIK